MAKAINTQFDQELSSDVSMEEIEGGSGSIVDTLKNAENVYKSFLYLKKMYGGSLSSAKTTGVGNVSNSVFEAIEIPEDTSYVRISSQSQGAELRINGGVYIMQDGEILSIPLVSPNPNASTPIEGDVFELKGTVSYIMMVPDEV